MGSRNYGIREPWNQGVMGSGTHRIMGSAGLEKSLESSKFGPRFHGLGTLPSHSNPEHPLGISSSQSPSKPPLAQLGAVPSHPIPCSWEQSPIPASPSSCREQWGPPGAASSPSAAGAWLSLGAVPWESPWE